MKRPFLLFLPFLLFIAGAFVACEEVEEAGKYDNWVPRNEAFIDSIKGKTGDNIVASLEDAEKMEVGTLYAISVPTSGTGVNGTLRPQYVYCKKLWKTDSGAYPLFTEKVSVFYRGTFITGEEFDGNFDGFGATDREIPLPLSDPLSENSPESKWPTAFNSPSEFVVSKVIAGWTWALQYMRVGERWMLYIPCKEYIIQQNTIATYDKESNALLTQYSVDQNDMGVTQMLLDGRAKMIPAGRRARFIKIIQGNAVVHIEGEAFNMIIPTSALIPE